MHNLPLTTLLLLLLTTLSTSINPEDIIGQYSLIKKEGNKIDCPNYIRHKSITPKADESRIEVYHETIYHNNKECEGTANGPALLLITAQVYERERPAEFSPNRTEVEDALINTNSIFGAEIVPRVCEGGSFGKHTFIAFIQNSTSSEFLDLEGLEKNYKFMFVYSVEEKDSNRCLYRDKNVKAIEGLPDENEGNEKKVEPTTLVETVDDGSCFPGGEELLMGDGGVVKMRDVARRDVVGGIEGVSRIFMFSHRNKEVLSEFMEIVTERGNKVRISPGHYLYVGDKLMPAGVVKVGDFVQGGKGDMLKVVEVRRVQDWGKYAPHSLNDELIVGGIRVSTFTTAVHPKIARWLLEPVKFLHRALNVDVVGGVLDEGAPRWLGRWMPKGPERVDV
eukprot:Plantae.Rhodophyta-Hildenbrandia_rubra.ctg30817.p1 GENE.Plantae.Rhodophyta-Hildenbrandia_rubra.ctg30817~~Plantae.Rhodophyta-Hildenbrandia_rubra.ctg30817.p1  ORF type:complete len:393 (-),score=88.64 Plantae.Rhodophyta-Hildenbrandia_rubra.ctg30817:560-1738(-)